MTPLVSRLCFVALFAAPSAIAADGNISGTYADLEGRAIEVSQSGDQVSLKADSANLPTQARQVANTVVLRGPITTSADGTFTLDTQFAEEFQPTPETKLKLRVTLDASGSRAPAGLHMTSCEWRIQMIVFAGGEIAGSETKTQACVGMWTKR